MTDHLETTTIAAPKAVRRSDVRDALESLGITNVDNLIEVHMNATRIELEYLARTNDGEPARHTVRIQVTIDGQVRQ